MSNKGRKLRTVIISLLMGSMLTLGGIYFYFSVVKDMVLVSKEDINTIEDVIESVGKYYEIDKEIEEKAIYTRDEDYKDYIAKEMVRMLDDDYAYYYTKEEYDNWKQSLKSSYYGIGITYTEIEDEYVVIDLNSEGPAKAAGIKIGDTILYVDGKEYDDINIMSDNIMGEAGTDVTLTLKRDGRTFDLTITRAKIDNKTVNYEILDGNIGYIDIDSFGLNTGDEFKQAMVSLTNSKVEKIVIDLRNNPGGLVSSCLDITDSLLPECKMLITKNKNDEEEVYNSDVLSTDMEYVLLVNENSASASEIMSAAIQDNDGGVLIGTQTFGKGVMQEHIELSDGSALKLTTMEYFSPSGDVINKIGITPDIIIKDNLNTNQDEQLNKALEILAK